VELRAYTAAELHAFTRSETYRHLPVVPISPQRALSHLRNPRLDPDDRTMFICWDNGRIAGYLGVFADAIYLRDERHKAGWLSCMWVDPDIRGKGIAKQLLQAVLDAWDRRILVTEFTPAAKGLYDRSGAFEDLLRPAGMRWYLRMNLAGILPRRQPRMAPLRPLLSLADQALNLPARLLGSLRGAAPDLDWEYLPELDAEWDAWIGQQQDGQLTRRTAADLNWMLQHPWIGNAPFPDRNSRRYHFSALEPRMQFLPAGLRSPDGAPAALMILALRNGALKVPYWYAHPAHGPQAAQLLLALAGGLGAHTLTAFHPGLLQALGSTAPRAWLRRPQQRHFIISTVFAAARAGQSAYAIQDGDGDAAFT
jgi:GNAT superfamily N-acetyltransferase